LFSYLLSPWIFNYSFTPAISFLEFSILSTLILQMANTRNRVTANNIENNGENNNNNDANPPPPPPPTLEKVLVMQGQMLQTMQQTMANMQATEPQAPPPSPKDRLGYFQCTKLPTFSHAVEPMDADD
jgi:hypothetical protein